MLILSELTSAILYRLASCTVFVNFLLGKSRSERKEHTTFVNSLWDTSAFSVFFVSYRYNAKVNLTEGRCPRSKAMVFADNGTTSVTVPNVNIGDCDYTIAFWTRLLHPSARISVSGSSRSGKILYLEAYAEFKIVFYCHEVSLTHVTCVESSKVFVGFVNLWNHFAVTWEQDNRVKLFVDGQIMNIAIRINLTYQEVISFWRIPPLPKEMFVIGGHSYRTVMDLHILGFALPPVEIFDLYRGQQFVNFMKRFNLI